LNHPRIQRALRWTAAGFVLLLAAISAEARPHRSGSWADAQFTYAQNLQEALERRPLQNRTRGDYERVINAYRRIYLGAPTSQRADPSVVAAAQMSEEMGRRFNDPDILRSAIQQYEFLRREYPGSKERFDALYRIGEIYKDDLHDKPRADAVFEEFLHRYPRNQFAEAARLALAEPAQKQASLKSNEAIKASVPKAKESKVSDSDGDADGEVSIKQVSPVEAANGKPSKVLGVRHWSTPDYTRVAIDLEQGVKYESQRIYNPDRVFFDLIDTKLDPKLKGKTYDVSDGLLKDIRMAQFKAGRTRIVLDLDEFSKFDASLATNPPRLIIDIHSKGTRTQPAEAAVVKPAAAAQEIADDGRASEIVPDLTDDSEESVSPPKSQVDRPARPNTVVLKNGVKKTIVDADDDEPAAGDLPAKYPAKQEDTVAKLDTPSVDPTSVKPDGAITSTPSISDHKKPSVSKRKTATSDPDMREAQPTASGERSLTRALGLKIGKIVIDPGHGGHDTGTIGPNGLEEKDLVLDVSRRLGKLLQSRLGAEVIYTRKDDTFIPLETRTAIANQEGADLFVSVHANSSHDPDARGVETYYLNFTSSPEALEVAARENAVSEKSIHELQDLVKKIALREKIDESQEFASDVQNSLYSGLAVKNPGVRDRGVKKAPFIVLIGANMPSILAEISFVSNPGDERRMETSDYRQKIAESLYRGIAKYVNGLSGVKVASKIDKDSGQ
jgi:N-acetylmuramoyl-L-alanine amidase